VRREIDLRAIGPEKPIRVAILVNQEPIERTPGFG
jgi:hypothetical protein